jgi:hypothetical protein
MSMREQPTEGRGNSFSSTASKAATMIDEQVHWGADTVSNLAHQTADRVGRATDYVQKTGKKLKDQASHLTEVASEHPTYVLIAVGVMAFALGFLCRGSRRASI